MKWYRKLHWQIMIGLILGLLWGLLSATAGFNKFTIDFIKPVGTIFITLLKLIAVPLVFVSLVAGITSLNDTAKLSRMGGKTIGIYIVTTILAVTIGLITVNIIQPGKALPEETKNELQETYRDVTTQSSETATVVLERGPLDFFVDIVPSNLVEATTDNTKMLQIVFVALLFGIGIIQIDRQKGQILIDVFESANEVVIKIVELIMEIAPIGVFGLMASVIVDLAGDDLGKAIGLLQALGWYSLTVVLGLTLHVLIVYTSMFKIFTPMKVGTFFKGIRPALLLGFSTSSSAATLPVTMDVVENNLGVDEEVSSFVLPIGATVNMDGTSLYQAVAAVFIAQALGMDLTIVQQLTIVLTATLASIGSAGVPGAGIVMLVIVLQAIDVPIEGIALILGVDRILDMIRTVVNITGDAAVSVTVAASEGKLSDPHIDD
ncbi:MAG: dicarboxylate/amino acid:cation symporter [Balneolaceae bacterium]